LDNYFDLFGFPLVLDLDMSALTKKYYALSRQYHPDNFTLASEEDQLKAEKQTSIINEGYKILMNAQSRLAHVLRLLGAIKDGEKEVMPQSFLMEMMDINEAIMELKFDPNEVSKQAVEIQILDFERRLKVNFAGSVSDLDLLSASEDVLKELKDYYLKSKYLRRLKDNLDNNPLEL